MHLLCISEGTENQKGVRGRGKEGVGLEGAVFTCGFFFNVLGGKPESFIVLCRNIRY